MYDKITVSPTNSKGYQIVIGHGVLASLSAMTKDLNYSKLAIVTDTNVAPYWLEQLKSSFKDKIACCIVLPPGERHKNLVSVEVILRDFVKASLDRRSLVLNLGGGVIGDMSGFAASIYMRGIRFIQIPTTLLSQVDASIGGKLGVDFELRKNLVGSFAQPELVAIDCQTLTTLPEREFKSGIAEIIKHALIKDAAHFNYLENNIIKANSTDIESIIKTSCLIKADVVKADEFELGERKILNFGHTMGHAIESLLLESAEMLLHGEAVALGMIAEAKLAHNLAMISEADLKRIEACIALQGLPTRLKSILTWQDIEAILLNDKKNTAGQINWSLISQDRTGKI